MFSGRVYCDAAFANARRIRSSAGAFGGGSDLRQGVLSAQRRAKDLLRKRHALGGKEATPRLGDVLLAVGAVLIRYARLTRGFCCR